MVKFKVDMQSQFAINSGGVHVVGNFQNWNKNESFMYSFGNKVYEYVAYIDSVNCEYKFSNGVSDETLTGSCKNSKGNRHILVTSDTLIDEVCFESCSDCISAGYKTTEVTSFVELFPNPSHEKTSLRINNNNGPFTISVSDFTGRIIKNYSNFNDKILSISTNELNKGIYLIDISNEVDLHTSLKLIVD